MRKVLALILAMLIMVPASVHVFAEDPLPEKVEIAFKVGDSNLKINGQYVEVETPYIAGEGTTLVPLRVITEAFGAEVLWEGETKKITLIYPDVNIVLQIGNKTAIVNDHEETLLEAPVLSNSTTMVPLRFISETFGAEVGYDDGYITVVKTIEDFGSTVTGITDLSKIGDSYYGWTMDTPKELTMTDRSFDGMYTDFSDENNNYISIEIYDADDSSYDEDYVASKGYSSYTLIKAEKFTDANKNKAYIVQYKDGDDILDIRGYYTSERTYELYSRYDASSGETKAMFSALLDSFKVENTDSATYDLSNVNNDGTRTFKDEKYKISIDIPADYDYYEEATGENEFLFAKYGDDDEFYGIHITVLSKSADVTAEKLANSDRNKRKAWANKELSEISTVKIVPYNGVNIYQYTQTIEGSVADDGTSVDSFFERGDYVYNIVVDVPSDEYEVIAPKILSSLKAEVLDKEEIGALLRSDIDEEIMITADCEVVKFQVPSTWEAYSKSSTGAVYEIFSNAAVVYLNAATDITSDSQLRSYVLDVSRSQTEEACCTLEESVTTTSINKKTFYKYVIKHKDDKSCVYSTYYITYNNKKLHVFSLVETDIYYGGSCDSEFLNMVKSVEFID